MRPQGSAPSAQKTLPIGGQRLLLTLAAGGLAGTLGFAAAWLEVRHRPPTLDQLSSFERLALAEQLLAVSPGIYLPAWYEPRIGYTLRPAAELKAWGNDFASNEIGYRTGKLPKAPGTYRIVFVGDSWTFGMGVAQEETFAAHVAVLAERHAARGEPVEAWVLALPGYNTLNEATALRFFFGRLQPDAVVLCPTPNDVDSSATVLPSGFLGPRLTADLQGAPHGLAFPDKYADSWLLTQRWQGVMDEIRSLEGFLEERSVPMLLFFTGSWRHDFVHRLMAGSGMSAPYLVAPLPLTVGRWRNAPPMGHPTPQAHSLFGVLVYHGLAELLGWPVLPAGAVPEPIAGSLAVHHPSKPSEERARVGRRAGRRRIPTHFTPGPEARHQIVGPLDEVSGTMGHGTTLWVRRGTNSRLLVVELAPIPEATGIYPLRVRGRVLWRRGGPGAEIAITATPAVQRLEVPLPPEIADGEIVDLVLSAERVFSVPRTAAPVSVRVVSVDQR